MRDIKIFHPLYVMGYNFLYRHDKKYKSEVDHTVNEYKKINPDIDSKKIHRDVVKTNAETMYSAEEYLLFELYGKSTEERNSYCNIEELLEHFSFDKKINTLPDDKYGRYCVFSDYFKRDILFMDFSKEYTEDYEKFISLHNVFMAKPIRGTKGIGIKKLNSTEVPDIDSLKKK